MNWWRRASWCAFDFANSSFTTIVVTVHFGPWFTQHVAPREMNATFSPDTTWALVNAAGTLVAALLATPLGALADSRGWRRAFLAVTVAVCCGATFLLGSAATLWPVAAFFILALTAFLLSENAISAFLPSIASPAEFGRMSGLGWSIGYAGGLLALLTVSPFAAAGDMPAVLRLTAIFFFVAALPALVFLREPPRAPRDTLTLRAWFREHRAQHVDTGRFLLALLFFQAGVSVIITMAAVYAQEVVHLDSSDLALLFIVLQAAAAAGAFGFGHLQDRIGLLRALSLSLVIWVVAVVCCTASDERAVFFCGAALAGLGMGATQASGRAVIAAFAPPDRTATWFGLWGFAGKGAALLGLVLFAVLRVALPLRESLLVSGSLFVIGLLFLRRVDVERGCRAAMPSASPPAQPTV